MHSGQAPHRRVPHSDWKPTIEGTDVVGAIEAIEDAQVQIKDKSAWRKSTLNVPNSTEETRVEAARQRFAISGNRTAIEEDFSGRKGLISALGERPANDRLTLYMRKPSDPNPRYIFQK